MPAGPGGFDEVDEPPVVLCELPEFGEPPGLDGLGETGAGFVGELPRGPLVVVVEPVPGPVAAKAFGADNAAAPSNAPTVKSESHALVHVFIAVPPYSSTIRGLLFSPGNKLVLIN